MKASCKDCQLTHYSFVKLVHVERANKILKKKKVNELARKLFKKNVGPRPDRRYEREKNKDEKAANVMVKMRDEQDRRQ